MSAPVLSVGLPGVVSWPRPRMRGGMRYPKAYLTARAAWALVVRHAANEQGWAAPPSTDHRLMVSALVWGGGKRDLDRIGTAVLDALQNGGAFVDDCAVDHLQMIRRRAKKGEAERVDVWVRVLDAEGE